MNKPKVISIIALCLFFMIVTVTYTNAFGNLKNKIQEELDINPFLKKQGIKLRVKDETSGYVTIEMYEGNLKLRERINNGTDILTGQIEQQWFWGSTSKEEKESVRIIRRTISVIRKMDDVKEVLLISAVNTKKDLDYFYKKGIDYSEKYELDDAIEWLSKAATNGHVEAQFKLGDMYNHLGNIKDNKKAVLWLGKAADQGHAEAQFWLGKLYYHGRKDVEKNYLEAFKLMKEPADQGYGSSLNHLASMYARCEDSNFRDSSKAIQYGLKVVAGGSADFYDYDSLAIAYANQGQYDKAIDALIKATNLFEEEKDLDEEEKSYFRKDFEDRLANYKTKLK